MFRELMNININGFIESVKRMGRNGNRRPLMIELISKRMKKYVLENASCFRNTGYAIADILDSVALQNRKKIQEGLRIARKEGKHAVIRNNKLYINGKECVPAGPSLPTPKSTPDISQRYTQPVRTTRTTLDGQNATGTSNSRSSEVNNKNSKNSNDLFRV